MPNWSEVLREIQDTQSENPNENALDKVRRKYLKTIFEHTGRNVIAYYSGWLQKPRSPDTAVNDKDKSGFMLSIHKMDKTKGLDLILHTPGGDLARVMRNWYCTDGLALNSKGIYMNGSLNFACFF